MTNRERLIKEGMLDPKTDLTHGQRDAIESLTGEEMDALISSKGKLASSWPAVLPPIIIVHGG